MNENEIDVISYMNHENYEQICRENGHSFEIETPYTGIPKAVICQCCGISYPVKTEDPTMSGQETGKYELLIGFKNGDEWGRYIIGSNFTDIADLLQSEVFDFANPTFDFTTTDGKRVFIASSEVREVVLVEIADVSPAFDITTIETRPGQHAMPLLARALNRLSWEEGAPPIVIDRYGNRWVIRADGLYSSEIDDGYVIQTLAEEYGPITLPDDSVVAAASDDNRDVTVAEHRGFIGNPDGGRL